MVVSEEICVTEVGCICIVFGDGDEDHFDREGGREGVACEVEPVVSGDGDSGGCGEGDGLGGGGDGLDPPELEAS